MAQVTVHALEATMDLPMTMVDPDEMEAHEMDG